MLHLCMLLAGNTQVSLHWLSEVNTLDMKNFDPDLVKLSIPDKKFSRNSTMITFNVGELQIYLQLGNVPFVMGPMHTFYSLNE